ncbi:hypothetical protein L226DRAFT_337493 [Lentinus tigrinus ALCF2SS1-7]|uniref:uncharacterized protein n=1 Tax=Lentinus tigrinus ALCF2SS1-7 TaxID=1328758 RepID=UPI001165CA38|nr:hypothetical protein L226DRAFT_337493 [Lentinus tigrinus ALCF2SS1-7]
MLHAIPKSRQYSVTLPWHFSLAFTSCVRWDAFQRPLSAANSLARPHIVRTLRRRHRFRLSRVETKLYISIYSPSNQKTYRQLNIWTNHVQGISRNRKWSYLRSVPVRRIHSAQPNGRTRKNQRECGDDNKGTSARMFPLLPNHYCAL